VHYLNYQYDLTTQRGGPVLDTTRPQSLVYANTAKGAVLVAAMHIAPPDRVTPRPGGCLTQWHVHISRPGLGRVTWRTRGSTGPGNVASSGGVCGTDMAGKALEELLISAEVQTARTRLEDFDAAEAAAEANPEGDQELRDLRQALTEMPGAVRMLIAALDRAGAASEEPQLDPGDSASTAGSKTASARP
jgi:hypothetical protein